MGTGKGMAVAVGRENSFAGQGVGVGVGLSSNLGYAVASIYTVTLVVSDGIVDSTPGDTTATVSEPSSITLSATRYKVKGLQKADLVWSEKSY